MKIPKPLFSTLCLLLVGLGAIGQPLPFRHSIGTHLFQFSPQLNYEYRWSQTQSSMISAIWKWESNHPENFMMIFDWYPGDFSKGLQLDFRHRIMLTRPRPNRLTGIMASGLGGVTWGRAMRYNPVRWRYTRMHVGGEIGYRWELGKKRKMLVAIYAGGVYRFPLLNLPDWYEYRSLWQGRMHGMSDQVSGLMFTSDIEIAFPLGRIKHNTQPLLPPIE